MSWHLFGLRFRRVWRRRQHQVDDLSQNATSQLEKNFLGRLGRLGLVWRFSVGWTLLFVLLGGCLIAQISALNSYYQTVQPVPGGLYSEGIQGTFTTANPLYAVNEVDTSVSRLIFASLLTYNNQNQLVGDLASGWSVNSAGTVYTVNLRPNLKWQDGQPLTSADVVFTYQTIQDPDAQSPLLSSWQNVKVAAVNSQTITFTLPNPLSSFPYSLTNGIVPEHILGTINIADLRSADFNTADPIGAGPFQWSSVGVSSDNQNDTETQINLVPYRHYWAGAPKLDSFTVDAFTRRGDLLNAYQNGQITAMVDLNGLPASISGNASNQVYNLPLTAGVYVFFKNSNPILSDAKVRQALVLAANRPAVVDSLEYSVIPVNEPLLQGQLGYNPSYVQTTDQPNQARQILSADGWSVGVGGTRSKNGQSLDFELTVPSNAEYLKDANILATEWKAVGVNVDIQSEPSMAFQSILSSHNYNAVLYGISIGVDPDVFVYWDSAQADVNSTEPLNFSEYRSSTADAALEAGRTRLGDQLRSIKYQSFLQAWQQDNPALGLYQPSLLYVSHVPIYGLGSNQINSDADRFDNVQNWMIRTGWVTDQS
jgi:peptide/nickel transport system substrate-binding protein